MEATPSSTANDASAATIRKEHSPKPEKPLESAQRPACGNVDNAKGVAHSPTGEQKQKQRTFDVLPKPANLIAIDSRHGEIVLGEGRAVHHRPVHAIEDLVEYPFAGEHGA